MQKSMVIRHDGFTFMELMVSITLFAMIAALLYSSYDLTIRALRQGEMKIQQGEQTRSVFELFRRQIASIYPVVPEEEEEEQNAAELKEEEQRTGRRPRTANQKLPYFLGSPDRVAFISLFSLRVNAIPGLCFVAYVVEPSENGEGESLVEYEKQYTGTNPMSDEVDQGIPESIYRYVLLNNLESVSFEFYGAEPIQTEREMKNKVEKQWFDSWDVEEMSDLPEAVRIRYTFPPGRGAQMTDRYIIVPIHSHGNITRRPMRGRSQRESK